jgi:hypothetical protein
VTFSGVEIFTVGAVELFPVPAGLTTLGVRMADPTSETGDVAEAIGTAAATLPPV